MTVKAEWQTIKVADGTEMRLYVARPDGAKGKVPAVIVVQEAFGVNKHIRSVTERVAELGYVAVSPEMFHRSAPPGFEGSYDDFNTVMPHMNALTEDGMVADLTATYKFLEGDAQADAKQTACVGYCMGGRVAFLANSVLPLKAAVSYYGGRIPALLAKHVNQHAPILFFWGGLDKHIPFEQRREVTSALDAAGKPYINVDFANADHGFFCEDRKVYHPDSARQSWALFAQFLEDRFAA
jgi:carboxymethylenebutenolidase